MSIRGKLALMTAGLIGAVVLSVALAVTAAQRSTIEEQSRLRLRGLTDGVTRLARESIQSRDQLMLLSYLMHLQKEHEEFAFASVSGAERTSTMGVDRPGLVYWTAEAGSRPDVLALKLGFDEAVLDAKIAKALQPLTRRTAAIAGAFMLLGWLGAFSFSKRLTSPLSALAAAVSAVRAGNLDVVVPAGGSDEVGLLAARFNEMTAHLKEFTEFREDLLHTLTHELNTPLGGLRGYLELLGDKKIPAEGPAREEVLQTMTAAVIRMEHSLGNALGLFRAGAEVGRPAPARNVWLSDILREACSLFGPEAAAKKIALVPPAENAQAFVHADPELLRRIVVNLVSNAVKYTPENGHVRLAVEGGKDGVRLTVSDDGCGISAEDLPHIFTKFYRAHAVDGRRRVKGTGLGLNIAQKAANALGGSITVYSTPGKGSTFIATFPRFAPVQEA